MMIPCTTSSLEPMLTFMDCDKMILGVALKECAGINEGKP